MEQLHTDISNVPVGDVDQDATEVATVLQNGVTQSTVQTELEQLHTDIGNIVDSDDQTASEVNTTINTKVTTATVQLELEKLNDDIDNIVDLDEQDATEVNTIVNAKVTTATVQLELEKLNDDIDNLPTGSGSDSSALHIDVDDELSTVTEKLVLVANDLIIIEDSVDNSKKKAKIGNIIPPTHTGQVVGNTNLTLSATAISEQGELVGAATGAEEVLVNDAGTLKRATTQDIADLVAVSLDDQDATEVNTVVNTKVTTATVQLELEKLNDDIAAIPAASDDQTSEEVNTVVNTKVTTATVQLELEKLNDDIDAIVANTDDQIATEVPFTSTTTLGITNTRDAVEAVKVIAESKLSTEELDKLELKSVLANFNTQLGAYDTAQAVIPNTWGTGNSTIRRVSDQLEIEMVVTLTGAITTPIFGFAPPETIDTTKLSENTDKVIFGMAQLYDVTDPASSFNCKVFYNSIADEFQLKLDDGTVVEYGVSIGAFGGDTADRVAIKMSYPVDGWSAIDEYELLREELVPNTPPVALSVTISGEAKVDELLTGSYIYSDLDGDGESLIGTELKWFSADDALGTNEAVIVGETGLTFTPDITYLGKNIRFSVTPEAVSGNVNGIEVFSSYTATLLQGVTYVTWASFRDNDVAGPNGSLIGDSSNLINTNHGNQQTRSISVGNGSVDIEINWLIKDQGVNLQAGFGLTDMANSAVSRSSGLAFAMQMELFSNAIHIVTRDDSGNVNPFINEPNANVGITENGIYLLTMKKQGALIEWFIDGNLITSINTWGSSVADLYICAGTGTHPDTLQECYYTLL